MTAARSSFRGIHDALAIVTLWGFAVAQPLYALFSEHPTFLSAQKLGSIELVLLALALSLLLPLAIVLPMLAMRVFGRLVYRSVHFAVCALLIALIAMPFLRRGMALPAALEFALAVGIALLLATAYARWAGARLFLAVLAPAVVIFPAVFLYTEPVRGLVLHERSAVQQSTDSDTAGPPILVIVFDEFATSILGDGRGNIDEQRFPNFADLARTSYWFRNATTVAAHTDVAMPALLTGRYPPLTERRPPPSLAAYPQNLFTWLADSYVIEAVEIVTAMCPSAVCDPLVPQTATERVHRLAGDVGVVYLHVVLPERWREGLPAINLAWADFAWDHAEAKVEDEYDMRDRLATGTARAESDFDALLAALQPDDEPVMRYFNTILPHAPYRYLPGGSVYPPGLGIPGTERIGRIVRWGDNAALIAHMYERFELQVKYVDAMLGRILQRMREQGVFDDTLLVVTADHGVSFRLNDYRREVSESNYRDILGVPLFIKVPGQTIGRVSDRNVELIDVVPTIAHILGREVPWAVDGEAVTDFDTPQRSEKRLASGARYRVLPARIDPVPLDSPGSPGMSLPFDLFPDGLDRRWIGRPVSEKELGERDDGVSGHIRQAALFEHINLDDGRLPARLTGSIAGLDVDSEPPVVAIALNGVVAAVVRSYPTPEAVFAFAVMLGEEQFREGRNHIAPYLLEADGAIERLLPLAQSEAPAYRLDGDADQDLTLIVVPPDGGAEQRLIVNQDEETITGYVDRVHCSGGHLHIRGWAVDHSGQRPARSVVVFAGATPIGAVPTGDERQDVADALNSNGFLAAGFSLELPASALEDADELTIAVYAIIEDDRAGALVVDRRLVDTDSCE